MRALTIGDDARRPSPLNSISPPPLHPCLSLCQVPVERPRKGKRGQRSGISFSALQKFNSYPCLTALSPVGRGFIALRYFETCASRSCPSREFIVPHVSEAAKPSEIVVKHIQHSRQRTSGPQALAGKRCSRAASGFQKEEMRCRPRNERRVCVRCRKEREEIESIDNVAIDIFQAPLSMMPVETPDQPCITPSMCIGWPSTHEPALRPLYVRKVSWEIGWEIGWDFSWEPGLYR